ncbi:probable NADH dehydrogenase [ubiquinone] 1 alpha subcomplex subunit 5, mitochondrial isoform X2 [Brassica napus]|uniref:probable NADH dehydrogenase [ubiquinone] 1 alpha subcomplex subunit 5, mitochondrial isoform X2 n=1 Tax=Brassica napus TaxID=3708 RepID=UPI0006AB7549|nr:probable NADH dehydrogenase [ubiquinone] 1 alpha subcomplex subunit 5, mitochondrial isoform X2 [Brassica napus]
MFLRAIGRPLLAKAKQTTGIVGVDVVPNARAVLIDLYSKTLPEDEGYRKAVESFTRHRLNVCKEEEDWEAIEKRLGCGQVEELIEEAQDELTLIAKMIANLGVWVKVFIRHLSLEWFLLHCHVRVFVFLLWIYLYNGTLGVFQMTTSVK